MERIKRHYNKIRRESVDKAPFAILLESLKKGNFSMKEVTDAFNHLVPKDDYDIDNYDEVLTYVIEYNKKI